jgi:hypothetical protein
MHDEVLAGLTTLIGVVHAGVYERLLDPAAVNRGGGLVRVLLDDREQIAEQPALLRRELGPLDIRVAINMPIGLVDAVDRRPLGGEQRRAGAVFAAVRTVPVLLAGPAQPPGR